GPTEAPLTQPRPGHADLAGMQKYGFVDSRDVLERASARETAARGVAGALAKLWLATLDVQVLSHVVRIGPVAAAPAPPPAIADLERIDADALRCLDPEASAAMVEEIKAAAKDGDSLGGVVEVVAHGVPVGLGSHVHWDRKLDSLLAGALMGIQAIKGVEVGDGFRTAARRGSAAHDEIEYGVDGAVSRRTNRAGGVEGGMTNGEPLRVRAAMKPISTVPKALDTIDTSTGEPAKAIHQRSDVCAVAPAAVVAQAMVALTLPDAVLEKFGGDSVAEVARNIAAYRAAIPDTLK